MCIKQEFPGLHPCLPGAGSAAGTDCTQPPASRRGAREGMVSSSPNRGRKLYFPVASFPGCSRGPAAETPVGSSGLLSVTSSAGSLSFYISCTSVHFFSLALETRRMFLPLPPSYNTIKLPSKAQWWQEMTNVTLPPVHYELLCIPFPEKASCPFLNLGYN